MVRSLLISLFCGMPLLTSAQAWDFSIPEKLPANVNTEYEEAAPLLTTDGKTLYFSRMLYPDNEGGKFSGSDIWVSSADNQMAWTKATSARLNDRGNNAVVGLSQDGQTVYMLNTTGSTRPAGIFVSKKTGNSFSKLELIPIEGLDPKGFLGFYVSPDFEVIFISMKADDSRGEEDLYVSTRNSAGQWTKPKNLGSSINTSGFEISPFLSPDKKRLYFSSNGHKGMGDADILYCDRLYNSWDTWSAPRNLGEKLNSKGFDAYFSIYGDTIAYFSSNRGGKYSDIYKVKVMPGNEVLAFGQRYLTSEEIEKTLGANVSRRITFAENAVELTPSQKELVFYIANKMADYRDVNFHISIIDENNRALRQQRVEAIARHLRESGIDNVRLLLSNSGKAGQNSKGSTMEILLYK
jgi:hypothetical protein